MPFKSKAQQRYMFKNEPKIALKWAKHTPDMENLPQHVQETADVLKERVKNIVEFYTVLMPEDHTTKVSDLVHHHTPIDFCEAINNGTCTYNEIEGFYMDEAEAMTAAQNIVKGLYESARGLEEKKEVVAKKLEKKIDQLDKQAQKHLKLAKQEPENKEKHRSLAKALLSQVEELEAKLKTVSTSKKELQPLEEFEVPKKSKKTK